MTAQTEMQATAAEGRAHDAIVDLLRDVPAARRTGVCRDAVTALVAEDQARAAEAGANVDTYFVLVAKRGAELPHDPEEAPVYRWTLTVESGRQLLAYGTHDAYRSRTEVHGVVEDWGRGMPRFRRRSRGFR